MASPISIIQFSSTVLSNIDRSSYFPVACIISAVSPNKPWFYDYLFQCCSNLTDLDAICWLFFNSSRYPMIPFILFIHHFFSMYSFHESLIPFSSPVTLPNTPFRQFDCVISCLSFTTCTPSMPLSSFLSSNFHTLSSFPLLLQQLPHSTTFPYVCMDLLTLHMFCAVSINNIFICCRGSFTSRYFHSASSL